MVSNETIALLFFVYLLIPVVAYFAWVLFVWVRRRVFKKGLDEEGEGAEEP